MPRWILIFVFVAATFSAGSATAFEMQFTLENSTTVTKANADTLTWGAAVPVSLSTTTSGAGAGKTTFTALTVTRSPDAFSTALFKMLAQGKHFASMTATVGGVTYKVGLVFVSAITHAVKDGKVSEEVKLQAGQAKITVGGASTGWDVTKNVAWSQ